MTALVAALAAWWKTSTELVWRILRPATTIGVPSSQLDSSRPCLLATKPSGNLAAARHASLVSVAQLSVAPFEHCAVSLPARRRRLVVFTSASPRCLDGGDVDLLHRHHRLEGMFCSAPSAGQGRRSAGGEVSGRPRGHPPTKLASGAALRARWLVLRLARRSGHLIRNRPICTI